MPIKRFMIVDSDEEIISTFKGILSDLQYQEISTTSDGDEALGLIDAKKIEFIIMSFDIEPMSGAVLTQRIRSVAAFAPIIVYSKRLKPDDLRLLGELGITNLLPMPFEHAKAKSMIEKICEEENQIDDTIKNLRKAHELMTGGSLEEATALLRECIADEAHTVVSHSLLGECLANQANYEEAEPLLQKALDTDARHAPAMQSLAKIFSKTGRTDEALKMLERMAEFSPKNVSTRVGLGSAYQDAGELEKAKEAFEQAKDIDPDCAEANDGLGTIAFEQGDFSLAKEFLANSPNSHEVAANLNNIAVGLIAKGQFDEGIQHYNAALDILSGADVRYQLEYNLGLAFKKKGELNQAFEHLCNSYLSNPKFVKAYAGIVRLSKDMREQGLKMPKALVDKVQAAREDHKEPEPTAAVSEESHADTPPEEDAS